MKIQCEVKGFFKYFMLRVYVDVCLLELSFWFVDFDELELYSYFF